jgi:cadmium resistance protein CadD (predicted permease)
MAGTLISSIISFVTTNIDDIFILTVFFSQTNELIKVKHIIIGQYAGIIFLIIISILGSIGLSILPEKYISFFGIFPVLLGIKAWFEYRDEKEAENNLVITFNTINSGFRYLVFIIIRVFIVTHSEWR